jgi:predicted regulator of Ras-like GTPase activity (Roadblock/LC7/MglB family)
VKEKVTVMDPNTPDSLDDILKRLLGAIPEVKSAAIVSAEGLPIASALPQGIDETRIAAMTAALLSLSERAIIEMAKGDFDQLYIKGSDGYLLVMQAGPNAVLTVSTTKEVRLGLILLDCRRTCEKIAQLI